MRSKDLTLADILPGYDYGIHNPYFKPSFRASQDYMWRKSGATVYFEPVTPEYGMAWFLHETQGTARTYIQAVIEYYMTSVNSARPTPFHDFFADEANGRIIDNLLANHILSRMYDVVVCADAEIDDDINPIGDPVDVFDLCAFQTSKKAGERFLQMLSWLYSDGKERIKLISLMEDNLNNLLNKVETINRRRDNNTPQNAANPDADPHLSYYSKNVNETDMMTLMARIKEIKNGIFDEYQEWANEFEEKFAIMCL